MLDAWLAGPWDEAPTEMAFEADYAEILAGLGRDLATLIQAEGPGSTVAQAAPPEAPRTPTEACAIAARRVYLRAPALVNVALNYKICVEHGLPLHPTVYYELKDARRWRLSRPVPELEAANRLYRESIELARAALRLEADWAGRAAAFAERLPPELPGFVYTGGGDKYTWIGSEPAKLASLARKVGTAGSADILVAAAHGSIMPALLLAEYLGLPLYFVRFSMFKRRDEEPILSLADEAWLSCWRESRALLYDEDVAGGTTLSAFRARLAPLFGEVLTACSIRHAGSAFKPDLAAVTWWD